MTQNISTYHFYRSNIVRINKNNVVNNYIIIINLYYCTKLLYITNI
jgi:hypothetical protein